MKKIITCTAIIMMIITLSCNTIERKAKKVINKTGEVVGKSTTEFVEGITEGVSNSLDCEIVLSHELKEAGIQVGKFTINDDSLRNKNNVLTLYIIFDKNYSGKVSAKVSDKNGVEYGRAMIQIDGTEGNAKYYDFIFDRRTRIEVKSSIILE